MVGERGRLPRGEGLLLRRVRDEPAVPGGAHEGPHGREAVRVRPLRREVRAVPGSRQTPEEFPRCSSMTDLTVLKRESCIIFLNLRELTKILYSMPIAGLELLYREQQILI